MPTAICTDCNRTDFAPGMDCKACGKPYDDATQARIRMHEAEITRAENPIVQNNIGRTCLKCGKVNALANFQPMERCPGCGAIYSRVQANQIATAQKKPEPQPGMFATVLTIMGVLFVFRVLFGSNDSTDAASYASTAATTARCDDNDARCLGIDAMDISYSPCVRAIEGHALYAHRWMDGMLDQRFNQIAWYDPANRVIAYTGTQLEVQNGFGAWQQRSYFCAWSLTGQLVETAGINE